jgi:hypothetical protein
MLKNLLLFLVSTLVSLGLLELALRALGPGDEVPHVLDAELIFKPGESRRLRYVRFAEHGGEVIETRFDKFGFREGGGDPLDRGAYRIFVYGDSFIQGSYSSVENTFAGKLAQYLDQQTSMPVSVVNAGVDGYGPDQVYLRMVRELPEFNPDLVVVSLFADNDVGDLIRNKLFRLNREGVLERHGFVLTDELLGHYEERQRLNDMPAIGKVVKDPELLRRDLRILLERRLGLNAGWLADVPIDTAYRTTPDVDWIEAWLKRGKDEFTDYVTNGNPGLKLDNLRSDHYDADVAIHPEQNFSKYKLALMDALIEDQVGFLRQQGIPFVLMIVPSPIDACKSYDWQVDPERYPDYDRRVLTRSIARTARRLYAPHVDLYEPFASGDCNNLYFHHGNNHWNERGQALAAGLVADWIRSSGNLKIEPRD